MPIITSPLRYPGGKSGLSPFLAKILETNGLMGCCFVEPFGGGAGAALNLLSAGAVKKIIINDIDSAISAFWRTILHSTDVFIEMLLDTNITIHEWKRQKEIYTLRKQHSDIELAFAVFFLNRTNRSGVLSANPIGGIHQTGKWKIDARFNKTDLIKRIKHIASMKNQITIQGIDAIDLLLQLETAAETTFAYIDPPYYNKGSELYLNSYSAKDHETLANFITQQHTFSWLMTYDNTEEIKWLYRHCRIEEYSLNYHVTRWKVGKEMCITPHNINHPTSPIEFKYSKTATTNTN